MSAHEPLIISTNFMTDGQLLYAAFTAFYASECLHWLPLGTVVLRSFGTGRSWSIVLPSAIVGSRTTGAVMAWPLPPFGTLLPVQSWPVIPSANDVCIGENQIAAGSRIPWEALHLRTEQRILWLTPTLHVRCCSEHAARLLERDLKSLQQAKIRCRPVLIEAWWKRSLSLPRARASVRRYRIATAALRPLEFMLALLAFVLFPAAFWYYGSESLRTLVALLLVFAHSITIAIVWRQLDRRLFPEESSSRWTHLLHLMLVPSTAIRAHDTLGVSCLAGMHPLAAAGAVLQPEALRTFASKWWRHWRYSQVGTPLHIASAQVLPRLEKLAHQLHLSVAMLDAPPARSVGCESYCPCCHTAYMLRETPCLECNGIQTQKWSED